MMSSVRNPKSARHRACGGFTLVEVITASAISVLIVLGATVLLITHIKDYRDQKLVREMQQNIRFAIDSISRDLRMADYGLNVRRTELPAWISWETNFTTNPLVTDGASGTPDTIRIAAAFDAARAYTAGALSPGATVVTVKDGKGLRFEKPQHRIIFVGRLETARVISRAGDSLTISTHPTESGHGLRYGHPADSPVERIEVTAYSCQIGPPGVFQGVPYLARSSEAGTLPGVLRNMVAAYIEDLQLSSDGYAIVLSITGRTSEPVSRRGTGDEDGHRRMTVTTRITPRNAGGVLLRQ